MISTTLFVLTVLDLWVHTHLLAVLRPLRTAKSGITSVTTKLGHPTPPPKYTLALLSALPQGNAAKRSQTPRIWQILPHKNAEKLGLVNFWGGGFVSSALRGPAIRKPPPPAVSKGFFELAPAELFLAFLQLCCVIWPQGICKG